MATHSYSGVKVKLLRGKFWFLRSKFRRLKGIPSRASLSYSWGIFGKTYSGAFLGISLSYSRVSLNNSRVSLSTSGVQLLFVMLRPFEIAKNLPQNKQNLLLSNKVFS